MKERRIKVELWKPQFLRPLGTLGLPVARLGETTDRESVIATSLTLSARVTDDLTRDGEWQRHRDRVEARTG
ncbi:hypothetical protein HAX54_053137, partial [Datura stramonium]|nr:hypothetical protein [Datura stramonium]